MRALGVEGTAHTIGVGVVEHDDRTGEVRVLANRSHMLRPVEGGIHPREAANHHAEWAGRLVHEALEEAGVRARDLDVVAFSQGPGLGPCLRVAAAAARGLALAADRPVLGVNHCVAHLEIGRALTDAEDPILLYASGGNTQVIGYTEGRYRVFGETIDVGIGNMLDKFARDQGIPFPGGPEVEKLARGGHELVDLPYTVKGMDVAFSGLLTAAKARLEQGARLEDVCFSLQEVAFAMLVEVTERALAHTEKDEVVMGGGVACNERLWEMTRTMCEARGARAYRPPKSVLVDNGAMIAHLGLVEHAAGVTMGLGETGVDQRQRTDDVAVTWRGAERHAFAGVPGAGVLYRGAEAVVASDSVAGRAAVRKTRLAKAYRLPELDRALRSSRARAEARLLVEARRAGVRTPLVMEFDAAEGALVLERVDAPQLKARLETAAPGEATALLGALGGAVARLHAAGLVHGDLTTSNALVAPDGPVLLDFGLGATARTPEEQGVDLHVLMEALGSTHAHLVDAWAWFLDGYRAGGGSRAAEAAVEELVRRGRYRGT